MKIFLSLFLSFIFAYGGVFDFVYSYKGEKLQKEGKLKDALQYYKKVENKTDAIHYNMGNIYYKEKKYKEAITSYQKVKKRYFTVQKTPQSWK
jgi:tetratricopeptide (TPR) repeat protein